RPGVHGDHHRAHRNPAPRPDRHAHPGDRLLVGQQLARLRHRGAVRGRHGAAVGADDLVPAAPADGDRVTHLVVTGVRASYGTTEVLHGVDLTVEAGTTTAILGASGCGKTTLLRVVAVFHTADAGEVRIGDRTVVGSGVAV